MGGIVVCCCSSVCEYVQERVLVKRGCIGWFITCCVDQYVDQCVDQHVEQYNTQVDKCKMVEMISQQGERVKLTTPVEAKGVFYAFVCVCVCLCMLVYGAPGDTHTALHIIA